MNPRLDLVATPARVLIVDDQPDNLELLQVILNWDGFVTSTAGSGEEALTSAAEQPPDLMLLDLVLPGLSGCEVITQMKNSPSTSKIPILIMSGMNDTVTRKRVFNAGAEDFISKPIDRHDLCQRVRSILKLAASGV